MQFLCVTIQTIAIESNVYLVLFTVILDKVFSRYVNKSLKVLIIHVRAILAGKDHILHTLGIGLELIYN